MNMANQYTLPLILVFLIVSMFTVAQNLPDINSAPQDLQTPPMENIHPAPGKRVKIILPEYRGTDVYHALYLPTDWEAGKTYPVIVEYAGNKWKTTQLKILKTTHFHNKLS